MRELLQSEITVVGTGIAGLWTAKALLDKGHSVTMIEKADQLATGATVRNEGWLHSGSYHAAAIDEEDIALSVAQNTAYGHAEILDFAPEAVDHDETFALLGTGPAAVRALSRWKEAGISHTPYSKDMLDELGTLDTERPEGIFRVDDKSIHTRRLCQKLADNIIEQGGRITTGTAFRPLESDKAELIASDGTIRTINSDIFLITAGNGVKDIVEQIGCRDVTIRRFKSHLLVFPRLTEHNYFYVDGGETGFMNHGLASVAGLNRDSIETGTPDYEVVTEKDDLLRAAVARIVPLAADFANNMLPIACLKPDVRYGNSMQPGLDEEIFTISEGYVCALPGKMTGAPHLAKRILDYIDATKLRRTYGLAGSFRQSPISVALRPVDNWSELHASFQGRNQLR